jgi:T4 gene Gp59 loader of gp41 DNA helicase
MTPHEVFCKYLAIKNHFTQPKYDYFRYNGKMNIKKETFDARRDRIIFQMMAKKIPSDNVEDVILSNILADNLYAVNYIHEDGQEVFRQYQKYMQSITYNFSNELDNALTAVDGDVRKLFKKSSNGYPEIVNLHYQHVVSLQTIVILDYFIQFLKKFEDLNGDYIWDKFLMKVRKYAPFVLRVIDKKKFGEIIKTKVEAYK